MLWKFNVTYCKELYVLYWCTFVKQLQTEIVFVFEEADYAFAVELKLVVVNCKKKRVLIFSHAEPQAPHDIKSMFNASTTSVIWICIFILLPSLFKFFQPLNFSWLIFGVGLLPLKFRCMNSAAEILQLWHMFRPGPGLF